MTDNPFEPILPNNPGDVPPMTFYVDPTPQDLLPPGHLEAGYVVLSTGGVLVAATRALLEVNDDRSLQLSRVDLPIPEDTMDQLHRMVWNQHQERRP